MLERIRFQAAFGLCLFLLSACGGGGGGGGDGRLSQIVITPDIGNLTVAETRSFSAVGMTASGKELDNVSFTWQSLDTSIASIDANGVVTGNTIGVATIIVTGTLKTGALTYTASNSATVGVHSPNSGQSNLTFSGTVSYEDKLYDKDGFTGTTELLPVRGTIINLVAIDGFTTIATGVTDNDGNFTFPNTDFPVIDNSARRAGVYIQVVSKTAPNNPAQIEIRNNTTDEALLSLISSGFDDSIETTFTGRQVTATAPSDIGGLFNILDVFSMASELIQQSGGPCTPAADPCAPPLLTAYWEPGTAEGTYYDDELDAIFILGGGDSEGDHDEYDDSVIAHEYGHFAVHHFSKDDSPGGAHFITDNTQDIRLSWSEGWGNFFSSAVRNNPIYLDTSTGGSFSFSLEDYSAAPTPSSLNSAAIYTTSEIAVTGVLWDVFDDSASLVSPIMEPHDQTALGFGPIWQTVIQFPDDKPATMERFWIQFMTLQTPSDADSLKAIMREREMKFFPPDDDAFEADESTTALLENGAQGHSLYLNATDPTGDEDVIPFTVTAGTRYRLETIELKNGADTLLFITNSPTSNTPIAGLQNDNRNGRNHGSCGVNLLGNNTCPDNDDTNLSSSITWTASNSETLYAHVQRSPNAPPSAGLLGSYKIQLTRLSN